MNSSEKNHPIPAFPYSIRIIEEKDNLLIANMIRNIFYDLDAPKEGTAFSDTSTDHLYELFQSEKKSVLWVAIDENDHVIGSCGIFPTEGLPADTVEIVKFYVASKTQGTGIGSRLFDKSIQSAIDIGYKNIYLETIQLFSTAIDMYKRRDFEFVEDALGNSGHHSCEIRMIKRL